MSEVFDSMTYREYLLTLIRVIGFLNCLGKDHKKNTSLERIVLYDFFLKYPEFLNNKEKADFDTKYSYFHWKPNYRVYSAILADAQARGLANYDTEVHRYMPTELSSEFVGGMSNSYVANLIDTSMYIKKNICKLTNKSINEKINLILENNRGL